MDSTVCAELYLHIGLSYEFAMMRKVEMGNFAPRKTAKLCHHIWTRKDTLKFKGNTAK